MNIYKPHIVDVNVRSMEVTTLSDTHKNRMITSINLECYGELKDGTTVEFFLVTSQQEREAIIRILDDVLKRFVSDNEANGNKTPTLAGIKYEDG